LQRLRRQKGLKAITLAKSVGINPCTLSGVENKRLVANPATRSRIAVALDVDEKRLFSAVTGLAV
jgi:transcriptional regulator with XRE-family HTH domain